MHMNEIKINKHIFANNIRRLMNMMKLSQTDLANETGISQSTISRYIKPDCNPTKINIKTLASFFFVNVIWLTTGKGPKWKVFFDPGKDDDKGKIINEHWLRTGKGNKFFPLNSLEIIDHMKYEKVAESQKEFEIQPSKLNLLANFTDQKWAIKIIQDISEIEKTKPDKRDDISNLLKTIIELIK